MYQKRPTLDTPACTQNASDRLNSIKLHKKKLCDYPAGCGTPYNVILRLKPKIYTQLKTVNFLQQQSVSGVKNSIWYDMNHAALTWRCHLTSFGTLIIKKRRSHGRPIFITEILIHGPSLYWNVGQMPFQMTIMFEHCINIHEKHVDAR